MISAMRNPALDAIRGIAVILVMAYHSGATSLPGGFLGVDVFFVLSGYLITPLLLEQHERTGRIELLRFYANRAARLYPTLLAMLAAFALFAPYVWPDHPVWHVILPGLYLTDYSIPLLGVPEQMRHTWSLSVEEHFYLAWPLLLPFVARARRPLLVLGGAYAIATAWRLWNAHELGWALAYYRFDTRLSGLVAGAALAFWRPAVTSPLVGFLGLALVSGAATAAHSRDVASLGWPLLAAELGAVIMVAAAAHGRFMAWAPLAYVGRLSYGLYVWHTVLLQAMIAVRPDLGTGWAALPAFALAAACYHGLDVPVARLRKRWFSARSYAAGASAAA